MNTTLTEPLTWEQLKEGSEYEIYCKPFDVTNKARLISFDTTILKRRIAYFQFSDRHFNPINKQQLTIMFMKDIYPGNNGVFALWDHDLKNNDIIPIS